MARIHNRMDVYLGDPLWLTEAMIVENHAQNQLTVKKRDQGGKWHVELELTDTELIVGNAKQWAWEGTRDDGERVRLTAVRRTTGCSSCGGSR